ncbi:peptide ABC transporter substrate-binding protein [uncultured Clostridium sp.]|uniref:peptide ABC transporter substrate-binding protein n=1 Tax=uncultured Clostridium sp. TaxID=59620 RepID=UPI0026122933|nr:peptide ABC transporter substrate-binding protein [uncultured Clostridium sp.]
MKVKNLKKFCLMAMAVAISTSTLVACGSDGAAPSGGGADKGQHLIYNMGADPKTLDPALNQEVQAGTAISNAFEGLMTLDENEKAKPGVAKDFTLSEDGLVYTFNLRDNAKWSDGEPVTANDFKYAWTRALDPKTAAGYSYQLYYIKGAEDFNVNDGKAEDLGIKVIDDYTLEVTLNSPTVYFPELMAFPAYFPVKEDVVSANEGWALKPETYVSNGPFKLTEWRQKDALVYSKNEHYWNKESVKLDTLEFRMIGDETTAYSEFKAGGLDMVDSIPPEEIDNAVKEGTGTIYPQIGTYYYSVNVSGNDLSHEALRDPKVIEALSLAIDRESLVKNVTKGGQEPATSFVPSGIKGIDGKPFSKKEYIPAKGDVEKAKKLLEEAGYPGGEGLPTFELMFNTEGAHSQIAQAVQGMWTGIGVNVELKNQEWKVFQGTRTAKNYQIARDGWVGDFVDPITFLDLFGTDVGLNNPGYSNAEFDELLDKSKAELDPAVREGYLKDAEEILMNDMAIIPIYYYTQPKAMQKNVSGVKVSQLGFISFTEASITAAE